MKEKTFQWLVISLLGVVLVLGLVALMKKTKTDGGTELTAFGKTLWQSKPKASENTETASKTAAKSNG